MQYIIKRIGRAGGGQYVAHPGSRHSYTNKTNAHRFATLEEAQANRCPDNEIVLTVR